MPFSISNILPILCSLYLVAGIFAAQTAGASDSRNSLRFARVAFIGEAASYIAEHNGYFEAQGLKVDIKQNSAGKESLADLFANHVDIITIAETPLVYAAFNRDDFYIIAGVAHSESIAGAVARRDKGISNPRDIKHRKIGLFQGTASDFLLDQYLITNNLDYEDIELVNLRPGELVDEIALGNIDAMFSWQPHINNATAKLGNNAYILPTAGLKTLDWLVVVRKQYAHRHADVLVKFLRAIDQANRYIVDQGSVAAEIFSTRSGIDQKLVNSMWENFSYELYLSEAILLNMEDQARWDISNREANEDSLPNFLNFIHFDAIEQVAPQSISLIR